MGLFVSFIPGPCPFLLQFRPSPESYCHSSHFSSLHGFLALAPEALGFCITEYGRKVNGILVLCRHLAQHLAISK